MPKARPPVRAGVPPADRRAGACRLRPNDLAHEFEPSAQAIRNWVAEADRQEGRGTVRPVTSTGEAVLTAAEREELARLRRENKQLKLERDILSRATAPPAFC